MMVVIFELWPRAGARSTYLDIAAELAARLEQVDGFLSVERFQSVTAPDKMLSLSFWRDEDALSRWRNMESHRGAQAVGRDSVFADYRLRVASVVRDYGITDRAQAPADSRGVHG
jgi:heme-degrading monooxygenase HmoA